MIFDFFNTLTDRLPARRERDSYAITARELGVPIEHVVSAYADCRLQRLTGNLGDTLATVRHIAALLGRPEVRADRLDTIVRARRSEIRSASQLAVDALPAIEAIRAQGVKVGVISNCGAELVEIWESVHDLSAALDVAVLSHSVGVCKPDPRIYELACLRIGVPAAATLFVGDGEDDELAGAERAGLSAIRLQRLSNREHGPASALPTAHTLADVAATVVRRVSLGGSR